MLTGIIPNIERLVIYFPKTELLSICLSMWQIQTTVSTLGLVILTLVIGLTSEKIYGITILQVLLEDRNMKYLCQLLFCIIAIPITYIYVIQLKFLGCLIGLFVSSTIIVTLLYKGIDYLLYPDKARERIKKILLNHVQKEIESYNNKIEKG
jgi:hypothetical protein